jgi:hypothetical protein
MDKTVLSSNSEVAGAECKIPAPSKKGIAGNNLHASLAAKDAAKQPISTFVAAAAGEWQEASSLYQWAKQQLGESQNAITGDMDNKDCDTGDLAIDVAGLDYLEANVLQVLLAVRDELVRRGRHLQVLNPSSSLREWFGFAGAEDLLDANSTAMANAA